ncbi:MAG TPA: RNA-guided pseudouridylation complex pseudouridine synthase subunit Cbf5 [Methanomassiliicoccales archaeon]|nr:RNA-guided pseudouridylation complex pseudouridine synthase subunit Cbf5 [Methanomassiliicoccales archaeon]
MTKMLVREKTQMSFRWGKEPSKRSLEELLQASVINLDKPQGPTSHQVSAWVRNIFDINKVGHGGTLDPKVSGVLPIALGKATRAMDLVLQSDKEYVCVMRLHRDVEEEKVRSVIDTFVGEIYQMPPVRAAVKRQLRTRRVHFIDILEIEGRDVLFRVGTDAGTYIRTLCVDIGEALGIGAHMESLRRARSGSMIEDDSVTLQDIKDAHVYWKEDGDERPLRRMLMPWEVILEPIPKIVLKGTAVDAICHGADLAAVGVQEVESTVEKKQLVALLTDKGEGVALAIAEMIAQQMVDAKEGLAARTNRVFMDPGTYPKMW